MDGVTYKAGLFKSKSTFEGGVFKGLILITLGEDFKNYLKEGEFPNSSRSSQEVLISQTLASRLELEVGDRFRIFFKTLQIKRFPTNEQLRL